MDERNGNQNIFKTGIAGQVKRQNELWTIEASESVRDFDVYQHECSRTADHGQLTEFRVATSALGLAGEAGEVADLLKKHLAHGHDLDREELVKELGDVLWYVSDLATMHGISLKEITKKNIEKLRRRYPNGFSKSDSINRIEAVKELTRISEEMGAYEKEIQGQ